MMAERAISGLRKGLGHHLGADAGDLDVHLQGRDALGGPCHFEVHVAQVILGALNIGQDLVASVRVADQAHCHAGDRRLDRHAGVHQRQGGSANRCHRGGAIRGKNLGNDADGVGEGLFGRDHRLKRPSLPARHDRPRGGSGPEGASPRPSRTAGSCSGACISWCAVGPRLSSSWASPSVPSVARDSTWVSPRVKSPEPCARGDRSISHQMGRTSAGARPSGRLPADSMRSRTM